MSKETYPSRYDARRKGLPLYQPDKPCPKHPDEPFYTCNDRCRMCVATTPRVR